MPEEQDDVQPEDITPEENDTPETSEPSVSAEELEALRAKAAKAEEYKKYADRTNAEIKKLKRELKPTEELETKQEPSYSDDRIERIELKAEGYSKEEIDQIMELGGARALENPLVKGAIDTMRRKAKSQDATPSGTAKSPIFKTFSEKDLRTTVPLDEFEKMVSQE